MSERITAAEAARRMGMTTAAVGQYCGRPGCPVEMDGNKRRVLWPDFVRWWGDERERVARERAAPANLDEARARREAAQAELAELELARARAEVAPVAEFEQEMTRAFSRVALRVRNFGAKVAPVVVGASSPGEALALIEPYIEEIIGELRADADEADDDGQSEAGDS